MCKVNLSIGHKVGEIGMGVLWDGWTKGVFFFRINTLALVEIGIIRPVFEEIPKKKE